MRCHRRQMASIALLPGRPPMQLQVDMSCMFSWWSIDVDSVQQLAPAEAVQQILLQRMALDPSLLQHRAIFVSPFPQGNDALGFSRKGRKLVRGRSGCSISQSHWTTTNLSRKSSYFDQGSGISAITRARTQRTHSCPHNGTHAHTHTCIHSRARARAHTHTHTHTHVQPYK
jgi:hypothetical protein